MCAGPGGRRVVVVDWPAVPLEQNQGVLEDGHCHGDGGEGRRGDCGRRNGPCRGKLDFSISLPHAATFSVATPADGRRRWYLVTVRTAGQ